MGMARSELEAVDGVDGYFRGAADGGRAHVKLQPQARTRQVRRDGDLAPSAPPAWTVRPVRPGTPHLPGPDVPHVKGQRRRLRGDADRDGRRYQFVGPAADHAADLCLRRFAALVSHAAETAEFVERDVSCQFGVTGSPGDPG